MTLRLYADRKGWPLKAVKVGLSHERIHARDGVDCETQEDVMVDHIHRRILVTGDLDDAQVARLLEIANRCPMHRTLEGGPEMTTEIDVAED